jgi:23S rRNA (cytosine1962-C5)-methyltransferase
MYSPEPLVGNPAPVELPIREHGVGYLIRPYDGFSTGLFLDQRENRRFLAGRSSGKRVLNCFAYTCGFSVAAAAKGAETTSVDLSRRYLEWGKRNFELNGLDAGKHRFFERDVFRFLRAGARRGDVYDLIVLDPPSFSRTKDGAVFSLSKDLARLISATMPLVASGGELFFSCNYSEISSRIAKEAFKRLEGSQEWRFVALPTPPEDFLWESYPLTSFLARRD